MDVSAEKGKSKEKYVVFGIKVVAAGLFLVVKIMVKLLL